MAEQVKPYWQRVIGTSYMALIVMGIWIGVTWGLVHKADWAGIEPGQIGDAFGMVTSLFTGFAALFAYKAYAAQKDQMSIQQTEVAKQIEILSAANLIQVIPQMVNEEISDIERLFRPLDEKYKLIDVSLKTAKKMADGIPETIKSLQIQMEGMKRTSSEMSSDPDGYMRRHRLSPDELTIHMASILASQLRCEKTIHANETAREHYLRIFQLKSALRTASDKMMQMPNPPE